MFVFMGGTLRVSEGKVAHGEYKWVHSHGGEIVTKTLPFTLIACKNERPAVVIGTECVDKGSFVYTGQPVNGSRKLPALDSFIQRLKFF